jgi:uncharacterized protein YecT (DUF1311 family)
MRIRFWTTGAALALVSAGSLAATATKCMENAPDRDALIQCSKYELVMPENRVGRAWQRLNDLHAGDSNALEQLREDKRRWDQERDARCVAESRAHATSAGQAMPLEQERAMLVCLAREFTSRAADLEARLPSATSAGAGR